MEIKWGIPIHVHPYMQVIQSLSCDPPASTPHFLIPPILIPQFLDYDMKTTI